MPLRSVVTIQHLFQSKWVTQLLEEAHSSRNTWPLDLSLHLLPLPLPVAGRTAVQEGLEAPYRFCRGLEA
jgi:hypothetical protein